MTLLAGLVRPRFLPVLFLVALFLLPACGRKAKPQPLRGAAAVQHSPIPAR
jgi:hypothetical protein